MLAALQSVIDDQTAARVPATPDAIRAARAAADLTVTDLASLLGVRDRTVERWERGLCLPQRSARLRLERVLAALAS